MPVKVNRKMIMLDKQPVISLPRGWVDFWNLKKEEPLPIFYNSILIIIPPTHPKREVLEERIRNFLIFDEGV
jgi:hypothetical protein